MLKNNTYVLTALLFGCLTLTACGGFKDMEAESGAAFSNDGTRAAGVMQRWEGSCNENSRWHLIPGVGDWCGEYDDSGFTKNHRFQIWVTGGEISPLAGAHQYFEESDGHFTQELEGEVINIEYVSSAIHHYLLVTAKTVNFTEEGDSNNYGDIILYYIPLDDNGRVVGGIEVLVRKAAGNTCSDWGVFVVKASPDGRFFSVLESKKNCDGLTNQLQLYRADTRAIVTTQAIETPVSSDPFLAHNGHVEETNGAWVKVPAGTNAEITEATLSVLRNPRTNWVEDEHGHENGTSSLANPIYRRAYVDYIDLLKSYSEAANYVSVFATKRGWNAGAFWKLNLLNSDGSGVETIEPTVAQNEMASIEYQVVLSDNRDFIDLEHSMIQPQRVRYYDHDAFQFQFHPELYDSSLKYAEDPTASFHWNSHGWGSGINEHAEHNAQVGDVFSASYDFITALPGDQSMMGSLMCYAVITAFEGGYPQVDDRCDEDDWTGVAKTVSWGRADWTYDNEDRLYICEVKGSTRSSVENAAISPTNLESGCKGQAWKLMTVGDF